MANFNDVDMNGVQPQEEFTPIPVGEYTAAIVASEVKQTKDYTGKYIKLEVEIIDGPFKKRKLWAMLNLWNKNEQTVSIAKREMASIKLATNCPNATDTSVFHNKPVIIVVGLKPAADGYDAQNVIKGWKPMQAAAKPATQVATGKPWESPPKVGDAPAATPQAEIF